MAEIITKYAELGPDRIWGVGRLVTSLVDLQSQAEPELADMGLSLHTSATSHTLLYATAIEARDDLEGFSNIYSRLRGRSPAYVAMNQVVTMGYSRVRRPGGSPDHTDLFITFSPEEIRPIGDERRIVRKNLRLPHETTPRHWLHLGELQRLEDGQGESLVAGMGKVRDIVGDRLVLSGVQLCALGRQDALPNPRQINA